jgi:predicted AAA+ superfamily ATPase
VPSIRDVLKESNPWWGAPFRVDFKERDIYDEIRGYMGMPQIIALTGLRRVGKTTLMYKMIEDWIGGGGDARDILYFSFEEFRNVEIRDIISEYESIMGSDFKEKRRLLLLDEIQKLDGWEDQLKRIYDLNYGRAKIIISGSESLFVRKRSKESLGGRIFEFKINTLSFKEFLRFNNKSYDNLEIHSKELLGLFDRFIKTMGFPELIGVEEKEKIRKYVRENIIEKVIYSDIPKIFKIDSPETVESMLNIIMDEPGQVINVQELAGEMHVSRRTASNYLNYLEWSFLIIKLYNFSKSRRKTERKLKKYYPALIAPELLFKDDAIYKSQVFEWLMVKLLGAGFFWRDAYKNEVDMVLTEGGIVPVEVKYGKIETKGILSFMSKFKIDTGYVVSYRQEQTIRSDGKTVKVVPAFKALLDKKQMLAGVRP